MNFSTLTLKPNQKDLTHIYIGQHCLSKVVENLDLSSKHYFIISQANIYREYGKLIEQPLLDKGGKVFPIMVDQGEQAKSMTSFSACLDQIFDIGVERTDTIIGLGGGVVTDLAGFISSTCLRGIDLIQCPTTLLCQVDAAIGGKTGINHSTGKNLIGTFYQPNHIIVDIATLQTLDLAEAQSGFAEVIKYALIRDVALYEFLIEHSDQLTQYNFKDHSTLWLSIVKSSCQNKIDVVQDDEKEANLRAILNFGHTIGHALEAYFDYSTYKHGECVAFGMVAATHIAEQKKHLCTNDAQSIYNLIKCFGYHKIALKSVDDDQIFSLLSRDKKVKHHVLRFVLPKTIGTVFMSSDVSQSDIYSSLAFIKQFFKGS